jgi:hypothetical protein
VALQPLTFVVPASVFAVTANTQPLMAPASTLPGARTLPPTVVPVGLKPVIVPPTLTPTLPVTTDVPVFEIVPPRSPKELAVLRFTIGVAKAGAPAANATTNRSDLLRKFTPFAIGVSAAKNCKDSMRSRISSSA